jgi:P27 family predicted phage terminase small subunit
MRGRKPKPLRIQIAEGDTRRRGARKLQELAEREPKAQRGLPPCPDHLKGIARDRWFFWAEELADMNIDHRPDDALLVGACMNYARALQAEALIDSEGLMIEDPIVKGRGENAQIVGYRKRTSPAAFIANAAWMRVHKFCSEFGFSPASRTRIAINMPDTSEKDLMEILSAPRERKKSWPDCEQSKDENPAN